MLAEFDKLLTVVSRKSKTTTKTEAAAFTRGSLTGAFYKHLNNELRHMFTDFPEDFWLKSTVFDVGSGNGTGLLGFNFVLGVQKLIGVEIQREMVIWGDRIVHKLIQHNQGKKNWESFNTQTLDLESSSCSSFFLEADVVYSLNLKFDPSVNECLRKQILEHCRPGTIVITISPLDRTRISKLHRNKTIPYMPQTYRKDNTTSPTLALVGGFIVPFKYCTWHSQCPLFTKLTKPKSHQGDGNVNCYIYRVQYSD